MTGALADMLQDVREGVASQPGRTGLAFVSILIGTVALALLMTILGGLGSRARQLIESFGVDVFAVSGTAGGTAGGTLDRRHVDLLRENLAGRARVSGVRIDEVEVPELGRPVTVLQTDAFLHEVKGWRLREGTFLNPVEVRNLSASAVLSRSLADAWNVKAGEAIRLKDTWYRVVGVLDSGARAAETEGEDRRFLTGEFFMAVPAGTFVAGRESAAGYRAAVDVVFVRSRHSGDFDTCLRLARRLMAQSAPPADALSWVTPESLLQKVSRLRRMIEVSVGSVAILCLLLGGTTLAGMMVANMRDRVTEIGLRMALGASARDVAMLFVVEALLIAATAGVAGSLAVHVLFLFLGDRLPFPTQLGVFTVLGPVLTVCVVGGASALWPARAAASIAPAEALRNE